MCAIEFRKKIKWELGVIWATKARQRALNLFNRWYVDVNVMLSSTAGKNIHIANVTLVTRSNLPAKFSPNYAILWLQCSCAFCLPSQKE